MVVPDSFRYTLIHATSWRGFEGIKASGSIRPNDGTLRESYFRCYFCKEKGAISLLDCADIEKAYTASPNECDTDWMQVFSFKSPFTVLLLVDRARIDMTRLLVPAIDDDRIGSMARPFMQPGEVCHVGPIPFSAITKIFASLDLSYFEEITDFHSDRTRVLAIVNNLREQKYVMQQRACEAKNSPGAYMFLDIGLSRRLTEDEIY